MAEYIWNPWHGCRKYSEGCLNCYVYRRDGSVGKDAGEIKLNRDFDLPVRKTAAGEFKIPSGANVFACMTSDFFIEEADSWRKDAFEMIKSRPDIEFKIITKRIQRMPECLPNDWVGGYDNVTVYCTMESQRQCDLRFPMFLSVPIAKRAVICEPMLTHIDLSRYLDNRISYVIAGGESGDNARVCNFDWIKDLRRQCLEAGVPFRFKQTGAVFQKDGHIYKIPRREQHSQARKVNMDIF